MSQQNHEGSSARAEGETQSIDVPVGQRHRGTRIRRIGQYHIKRVIASGGMGTVYEATQEKPRRTVALKLMNQGIASRSALRRFEYESQILARLRHPGVAQVYDAGTHLDASGTVPYFAMEYIPNAKSITQFAKAKKIPTKERMKLFAQVCDAVHHGHQKGVIHRDLKPSNILVDSSGQVKIIDFGVARSTDSDMAVTTLQTDVGQLIGTLQYMSPEQCEADPHDIDVRSDVYALGVVFYELLADQLPYDVGQRAIHEATRVIQESPPAKLSALNRRLRGDIETIAFKALEKDRERRYQSATEFSQDIQRYLASEPIIARRASVLYQIRVFARRNKAAFSAIATVFFVLVIGVAVSRWQYLRAESARREADVAREASEKDRDAAEASRDEAEAVVGFLGGMLRDVNPKGGNKDVTVREVLERASETVGEKFQDRPLVEAYLRQTIAASYMGLGLWELAETHAKAAAVLRRRDDPQRLSSLRLLSYSLDRQAKHAEASELLRELLPLSRRILGDEHPGTLATMFRTAVVLVEQGKYAEAERMHREVYSIRRRVLGDDNPDTILSAYYLGEMAHRQGRLIEAEERYREVLEARRRVLGEEHPDTLHAMHNLGWTLNEQGKFGAGEIVHRQTLEIRRRVLGEEHPNTLDSLQSLGNSLAGQARYSEALPLLRQTLEAWRRVLGPEHPRTLESMFSLAMALEDLGNHSEAVALQEQTLEIRRRILGEVHPETLESMNHLVRLYLTRSPAAERDPHSVLALAKELNQLTNYGNPEHLDTLAMAHFMAGNTNRAIETQKKAIALLLPGKSPTRSELEARLTEYREAPNR